MRRRATFMPTEADIARAKAFWQGTMVGSLFVLGIIIIGIVTKG